MAAGGGVCPPGGGQPREQPSYRSPLAGNPRMLLTPVGHFETRTHSVNKNFCFITWFCVVAEVITNENKIKVLRHRQKVYKQNLQGTGILPTSEFM